MQLIITIVKTPDKIPISTIDDHDLNNLALNNFGGIFLFIPLYY